MIRSLLTYLFLFVLFGVTAQTDSTEIDVKKLLIEKEYKSVVQHLEPQLEGNLSFSDYYNLGIAYTELNELRKGLWSFESALKIDPLNEKAQHNAAFVYSKLVEDGVWKNPFSWVDRIAVQLKGIWIPMLIVAGLLLTISTFLSVGNIKLKRNGLKKLMFPSLLLVIISLVGLNLLNEHATNNSVVIPIHNGVELFLNPEGTAIDGQINLPIKNQFVKYSNDSSWVCLLNNQDRFWLKTKEAYIY